MMSRPFLSGVLCVLMAAGLAAAGEPSGPVIAGRVIDAKSGEPVPGATVSIAGRAIGTVTDVFGEFRLTEMPDSPFVLRISSMEHWDVSIHQLVPGMEYCGLEIRLHRPPWVTERTPLDSEVTVPELPSPNDLVTVEDLLRQVADIVPSWRNVIFIRGTRAGTVSRVRDTSNVE